MIQNEKQTTLQNHCFNYQIIQQIFLTRFNFQRSQFTHQKFEQLAELLLKCPMVYATSKFDVGKVNSLHQLLKPDAVFKIQRASKIQIHFQDKVNRFLDILEEYDII